MRVVHVVEELSTAQTGITTFATQLSRYLVRTGFDVHLVSVGGADVELPEEVQLSLAPSSFVGRPYNWSPQLRRLIRRATDSSNSVVHIHGLWKAPQRIASEVGRKRAIPHVVSAHGMLQPELWKRESAVKRAKKEAYWRAIAKPAFRDGTMHAITPGEEREIRRRGLSDVVTIPSAIDVSHVDAQLRPATGSHAWGRSVVFLGRLHPVKNVQGLIDAFSLADVPSDSSLVIAGPAEDEHYEDKLRAMVIERGFSDRVHFLGRVDGADKWSLLRSAWVVAQPSHSEVLGYVSLEAAACGTPAICSTASGLSRDWATAGLLVGSGSRELAGALETALNWTPAERKSRGTDMRALVEREYSWESVGERWIDLYTGILQENPVP